MSDKHSEQWLHEFKKTAEGVRDDAERKMVMAESVAIDPTRVREQTTLNEIVADFGPTAAESRAAAEFFSAEGVRDAALREAGEFAKAVIDGGAPKIHGLEQGPGETDEEFAARVRTVEIDPKKFLIDEAQTYTGAFQFNVVPWFPFTITVLPGVSITLFADGKWEGSTEALREAMATSSSNFIDGTHRIFLWLLLRQMENDKRFW